MKKRDNGGNAVVAAVREAAKQTGIVPEVAFYPTDEQRLIKSKFWLAYKQNPSVDRDEVTPAMVEQLTGRSIANWAKDSEFWLWFAARDSVRENLELAAEKASEWAILALDPLSPLNDNARVQLVKIVLEFTGRTPPSRKEIKWADRELEDMDEAQLDAMIERLSQKKLKSGPPR